MSTFPPDQSGLVPRRRHQSGVAIVGLDHRFEWVNSELCAMLDYEPHELVGRTFEDITHPDDVKLDVHLTSRLVNGEIASYEFAKRYIDKSGQIVPIHLTASAVRDRAGEALYLLGLIDRADSSGGPGRFVYTANDDVERIRAAILM